MSNKDYVTELSEELNQIYSHLGVEAFPNQQEEALKIIDGFDEKINQLEKALELACQHIANYSDSCHYCPKYQYRDFFCDEDCDFDWGDNDCIDWLMNYFNKEAKEQLKDE